MTETRWGGRARESREAGTWRPIGRPGPCTATLTQTHSGFAGSISYLPGTFVSPLVPFPSLPSVFLALAPLSGKSVEGGFSREQVRPVR